ncbi:hypothetical protein CPT_Stahl106 [Bacillus phage Stahl]|uniref:Uncharacterized protein n=1 Tax=Bacillus phage Stahl TaxID=1610832 RepID=A0A0E3GMP8_9CAUD|nr:hypothetical protein CPT_Stahl106 [Bacillus phage Stahl]AKA61534.1 hypothetical protein CPT_Stahl106 [Bacillus phage Stahl]
MNEELYNSACGIVGICNLDSEEELENEIKELEENPDFTFFGTFEMTQDADEELKHQGFSLDDITKMSLNRYGNVIECLKAPNSDYHVYVGAR